MVQEDHSCRRWIEGGQAGRRDGMEPGPRRQWWEQRQGVSGASEEGRDAVSGAWRRGSYSQEKGLVCMIRLMVVLLLRRAQEVSRYWGHVSLRCPRAAGSRGHLGSAQSC